MPDSLAKINQDIARLKDSSSDSTTTLEIAKSCLQPVFGDGPKTAKIVFIGEAPGAEEDKQGLPFVGRSGKLLNEMLASISLDRQSVYITNIVKFRPPDNRDPSSHEKEVCSQFLVREMQVIQPKIIVPLGRHSMNFFFPDFKISTARGVPVTANCAWNPGQVFLPLYHPAVALYNPNHRQTLFADFQKLKELLEGEDLSTSRLRT